MSGVVETSRVDSAWATVMARGRALAWHRDRTSVRGRRLRLVGALSAPVTAETASWLTAIGNRGFGPDDLLDRVRLADRVSSWAQAQAAEALADYAGPHGDGIEERHLRFEVRIARNASDDAAGRDLAAARALAGPCHAVRDLWVQGRISFRHVSAVLDRTAGIDDSLAEAVVAALADRLPSLPSTRVRAEVTRLLAKLAPRAMSERAASARRHQVGVAFRSLPDGLGEVVATLPVEQARLALEQIDSAADALLLHRRECDACAQSVPDEIGPARARSFLDLVLGASSVGTMIGDVGVRDETSGRAGRRRGELQVVVDAATLFGLADNPGLLNGQPVPATIARELATQCGSMRRIVTDPVLGHLLDYGDRTYLPKALRDFLVARDGRCNAPCCGQPAARSQLDHVVPFPEGPSSTTNGRMKCKRDHDLKTRGFVVERTDSADGSTRWTTKHGNGGVTPARPYLNHPDDPPPF